MRRGFSGWTPTQAERDARRYMDLVGDSLDFKGLAKAMCEEKFFCQVVLPTPQDAGLLNLTAELRRLQSEAQGFLGPPVKPYQGMFLDCLKERKPR